MYSNPPMDYPYLTPSSHQWSIPPTYPTNPSFTTPTTPSFPSFPWELFTPYYTHGSSSPKLYLNHGYSPHHHSHLQQHHYGKQLLTSHHPFTQHHPMNTSTHMGSCYPEATYHFHCPETTYRTRISRDFAKHFQVSHPCFKKSKKTPKTPLKDNKSVSNHKPQPRLFNRSKSMSGGRSNNSGGRSNNSGNIHGNPKFRNRGSVDRESLFVEGGFLSDWNPSFSNRNLGSNGIFNRTTDDDSVSSFDYLTEKVAFLLGTSNGFLSLNDVESTVVVHGTQESVKAESIDELTKSKNVQENSEGFHEATLAVEVFGAIGSLAQFRLTGSQNDFIVVDSDSGRKIILDYNKEKNVFDKIHQETFGKSGCRKTVPGQYISVDPKGRAVMIGACEKQKLVYVLNRDIATRLTISLPLEAHKWHTLVFSIRGVDCGFESPIFAAIELDYSEADQDSTVNDKTGEMFRVEMVDWTGGAIKDVLIIIFANSGARNLYVIHIVTAVKVFYQKHVPFPVSFLVVITTQVLGIGWVGMFQKYLVESAAMWWPANLVQVSLFRALHEKEERTKRGLTRSQFIIIASLRSFTYYVSPGYLFQMLTSFSWVCWLFQQHNVLAQQFGSGVNGLGIGAIGLDWSAISTYLGCLPASPWFATANVAADFVFVMYILTPLCYWFNVYSAKTVRIFSNKLFTSKGSVYNITDIISSNFHIDLAAYEKQGRLHLSTFFAMTYGVGFAALTASMDTHIKLMRKYNHVLEPRFCTGVSNMSRSGGPQYGVPPWGDMQGDMIANFPSHAPKGFVVEDERFKSFQIPSQQNIDQREFEDAQVVMIILFQFKRWDPGRKTN